MKIKCTKRASPKILKKNVPMPMLTTATLVCTAQRQNSNLKFLLQAHRTNLPFLSSPQTCAPGYERVDTGRFKGECRQPDLSCPRGYYGDPGRGVECQVCPCPLAMPSNQ